MYSLFDLNNSTFNGQKVTILLDEHDVPWFCVNEIGEIIGYNNSNKKVTDDIKKKYIKFFKDIDLQHHTHQYITNHTKFINESGLYQLIFTSELPFAKKFKELVLEEIYFFESLLF